MTYHNYNIWQHGMKVAGSSSRNAEAALRDALHYAMLYEIDGPVTVKYRNRIVYRSKPSGSDSNAGTSRMNLNPEASQ